MRSSSPLLSMTVSLPDVDLLKKPEISSEKMEEVTVLIVDEDPAFALGLKTFLKEYVGFSKVQIAASGSEALKLMEEDKSIEIVTLDYQMPGMNGIEVLRRLNSNPPHPLTVLMITGYPSDELEDEFRKLSSADILATHFIAKPVDFEELEPLILNSYQDLEQSKELARKIAEEEAARLKKEAEEAEAALNPQSEAGETEGNAETKAISSSTGSGASGILVNNDPTGPISPIAAAALLAQRDPTEPVPIIETINPEISAKLDEMTAKMAHLENEVNRINAKTPTVQERFWLDILKIAAVVAIGFIAYQFGIFGRIGEYFGVGEAEIAEEATDGNVAPPETVSTEDVAEASPVNEEPPAAAEDPEEAQPEAPTDPTPEAPTPDAPGEPEPPSATVQTPPIENEEAAALEVDSQVDAVSSIDA